MKNQISVLLFLVCSYTVVGQRVWLYAFVPADHGGEVLFPHFINHYHQLGITYRRMLVLVHHDPEKYERGALERIMGMCHGYGLECKVWEGAFTLDRQYEEHLRMLRDFVYDPYDWILYADVDEFQDWEGPIKYAVERANRNRAYFITGPRIHRLGPTLTSDRVPSMSSEKQPDNILDAFPKRCPSPTIVYQYIDPEAVEATSPLATPVRHHYDSRVVAFRNSMRVTRSRDSVLSPDDAKWYLGNCSRLEQSKCPRISLEGYPKDLFHLTPFHKYKNQYRYSGTPSNSDIHLNITLWHDVEWAGMQVPIHSLEWSRDVLPKHRDWLERYKGTCRDIHADDRTCSPLLKRWPRVASLFKQAIHGKSLDLGYECDEGGLLGELETNSTYMGLAWEQFETSLKVVSKVRNDQIGDSRTRLEHRLSKPAAG